MRANESEILMPVTVEQIAAAIHRMSKADRNELLRLVPELAASAASKRLANTIDTFNFQKVRELLQDVKGEMSDTIQEERDER
jgi:hypothetical protein